MNMQTFTTEHYWGICITGFCVIVVFSILMGCRSCKKNKAFRLGYNDKLTFGGEPGKSPNHAR